MNTVDIAKDHIIENIDFKELARTHKTGLTRKLLEVIQVN